MVFGKLSKEQLIKGLLALSDEDKAAVIAEVQKEPEAEPAAEPQKEEVDVAVQDTPEEPKEDAIPEEPAKKPAEDVAPEAAEPEAPVEEPALDAQAEENKEDVIQGLTDRIGALEEALKQFDELKAKMEEYTSKQAEQFGYKGQIPGAKKDMQDMTADELKHSILAGN